MPSLPKGRSDAMRSAIRIPRPSTLQRCVLALCLLIGSVAVWSVAPTSAAVVPYRIDLRVLLLDDNSPWVDAIASEMTVEGVPFTTVPLSDPSRPVITDAFLSSGDRAFYQGVVGPDNLLSLLSASERTSLRTFESKFGVREVDGYNYGNPTLGLTAVDGVDLTGKTATVTADGKNAGFGYLNGPVPFAIGSFGYISPPLAPRRPSRGSDVHHARRRSCGERRNRFAVGRVREWWPRATHHHGVVRRGDAAVQDARPRHRHLGDPRRALRLQPQQLHVPRRRRLLRRTALWNSAANCTPGEDCPRDANGNSILPETSARMTAGRRRLCGRVGAGEQLSTHACLQRLLRRRRGHDPPTQAFVANASAVPLAEPRLRAPLPGLRPELHGHAVGLHQSIAAGKTVWVSQADIYNEIENNIALGNTLGLPFDPTEYLSGEHSGLFLDPAAAGRQPQLRRGADPGRHPAHRRRRIARAGARQVGSATTIPRHPTALYYNTDTQGCSGRRVQLALRPRRQWRQRLLRGQRRRRRRASLRWIRRRFRRLHRAHGRGVRPELHPRNDPRPFYAHVTNMTD